MPKKQYAVHLYVVSRVKLNMIADNALDAAQLAAETFNPRRYLPTSDYAEEVLRAVVDEVNDVDFENTQYYENTTKGWRQYEQEAG